MSAQLGDSTPCLSFIGIVDFSQEARWIYMTDSVTELLGYEPSELRGRPSLELVHPDEEARVRQLHYETIKQDKAAVLVYLRLMHKDPMRGFILCGISRTVVHNVLIGSVSFANAGAKALHNASTAQEITVISPAPELEFRRWHDPSPMPPSPIPTALSRPLPSGPFLKAGIQAAASSYASEPHRTPSPADSSTSNGSRGPLLSLSATSPPPTRVASLLTDQSPSGISYPTPGTQSSRTALILNRFSQQNTIMYCSNDHIICQRGVPSVWQGRSFFDFVSKEDESVVRKWIDTVKSWGVNERGQPSDGGFGFCKFSLVSSGRQPTSPKTRERPLREHDYPTTKSKPHRNNQHSGMNGRRLSHANKNSHSNGAGPEERIPVDAIFSAHSDGLMVILRRAT